jgi:hypothetical protein
MNRLRFRFIVALVVVLGLSAGVAWACRSWIVYQGDKQCLCTECGGTVSCIC